MFDYQKLLENHRLPDPILRAIIRGRLKALIHTLDQEVEKNPPHQWIDQLKQSSISVQEIEVPPEFFCQVLGRHMKYSCGNWAVQDADLDAAEEAMLRLTIQRAEISDGQDILDLGCGWGSLSLEIARKFSRSKITTVTNSDTQKAWIDQMAANEGLTNLCVMTADLKSLKSELIFDRIVSVETLEYLHNFEKLFQEISRRLKPGGKMFAQFFCHREYSYALGSGSASAVTPHFLKGRIMPTENLFRRFDKDLHVTNTWKVTGLHYHRTCEAWLKRMDLRKTSLFQVFAQTYGENQTLIWFQRWRVFFLTWSEMFRFNQGNEWFVTHNLFEKN